MNNPGSRCRVQVGDEDGGKNVPAPRGPSRKANGEGDSHRFCAKALLPTYHGKVKCIYIDPPYNTGKE